MERKVRLSHGFQSDTTKSIHVWSLGLRDLPAVTSLARTCSQQHARQRQTPPSEPRKQCWQTAPMAPPSYPEGNVGTGSDSPLSHTADNVGTSWESTSLFFLCMPLARPQPQHCLWGWTGNQVKPAQHCLWGWRGWGVGMLNIVSGGGEGAAYDSRTHKLRQDTTMFHILGRASQPCVVVPAALLV